MTYFFSRQFFLLTFLSGFVFSGAAFGQYKSKYPDIPVIDVHTHATKVNDAFNYLKVSEAIKAKYGSNLAYFVGLSAFIDPIAEIKAASENRFLFAVSEMSPHKGLSKTPEEIVDMVHHGGYTGLKFWFADPRRVIKEGETGIQKIDDPYYDQFFSTFEREKILMTSLHIADPNGSFDNRYEWMKEPVYFWEQIRAFENVVAKYPKLTIIAAHGAWLVCQDAQIDYLRYMLSTYPNLYIDLAATFQYMPGVNYANLRDFIMEYQDRIVYGTDIGSVADNAINGYADRYAKTFAILETDQTVQGSFFGTAPVRGLNLPRAILEKIYYKNALKLYPGLKEAMNEKRQ